MGKGNLPTVFVNCEAEIPSAAKWNNDFAFLNFTARSLIKNGDFENFVTTIPEYWSVYGTTDHSSTHKVGSKSLVFGHGTNYVYQSAIVQGFLNGRTVKAWAWVKCTSPGLARIYITDGVGSTGSAPHTGGGGWELLTVEHVVDNAATDVAIQLYSSTTSWVDGIYFDGAVLVDYTDCLGFLAGGPDPARGEPIRARIHMLGDGSVPQLFNVETASRTALGTYDMTWSTPFADANYVVVGSVFSSGTAGGVIEISAQSAAGITVLTRDLDKNLTDFDFFTLVAMGTQ